MNSSEQIRMLEGVQGLEIFSDRLKSTDLFPLRSSTVETIQVNLGKRCNLSCKHCHVGAGPDRTEEMSEETLRKCLAVIRNSDITTVDVTGGAPEMNSCLPWFIAAVGQLNRRIVVRSNLVVLLDPAYKHYNEVYARNGVEIIGSLPDYIPVKADRQRGGGSFLKSIEAVRELNKKGYGIAGTGLILNLVHNPAGAFLPASQNSLEFEYRRVLKIEYGVEFNSLYCMNNCPVGRFLDFLLRTDNLRDYMHALIHAFNPAAANNVMCRDTLSVAWDGRLYDCDFNQMLDLPVRTSSAPTIDMVDLERLKNREIVIHNHCYACTAGAGSSCQGSIA